LSVGLTSDAQTNNENNETDHEELWQPAWGVRTGAQPSRSPEQGFILIPSTAIIGLQGFFPLKGQAAAGVGSIEYPVSERHRLATL
jgi:ubiquitin-conjugating enzyme E2 J1